MELTAALLWMIPSGVAVTLLASLASMALGLPIGFLIMTLRTSQSRVLRAFSMGYVSFFRGTPALLQVLIAYYVIPSILDINLPALAAGIAALSMNTSAFLSEAFRGCLGSIPSGQRAAAEALGMSRIVIWRHVILPQIFYRALPLVTNEFGLLLKTTSILSIVSVTELASVSRNFSDATHLPLPVYFGTAIIYFIILALVSVVSHRLEAKISIFTAHAV